MTVDFRPDLTILVGENNGGKSNIVEAIRLLTKPLNGRRERYAEDEDIRRGASEQNFAIEGVFDNLSDTLRGLLVSALPDPLKREAKFGFRYEGVSDQYPRGRSRIWAGRFESHEPEAGSTDLIRHVYLPPLRDAQQALGTSSGSRVMSLFRQFISKNQEEAFVQSLRRSDQRPEILESINTEVQRALALLTDGVRQQAAVLDFSAESLMDLARDLRFRMADAGYEPEDIRVSGLGYSNLLYISTVIVELVKSAEADLTLFLVEEPEAHLHPQLQALVLDFLLERARHSIDREIVPGQPEGRIQVIASTHSPNLTASVSPNHLVIIRSQGVESEGGSTRESVCIPIAGLGLEARMVNKISRYLDATRSAMLFGSRVGLVEGIAESILLPVIARHLVLKDDPGAIRRFNGAVIVPIDGVDFQPYVEILLRKAGEARIADKLVVITDADPTVAGNRRERLTGIAAQHGSSDALEVFTNNHTLEADLLAAGNDAILKRAFLDLHPRSERDWESRIEAANSSDRPAAFVELLKAKGTRKGDLAQAIAEQVVEPTQSSEGEPGPVLAVPPYLEAAIRALVAE